MAKASPDTSGPAKPAEAEDPSAAELHRKAKAVMQENARRLKDALAAQQRYDEVNAAGAAAAAKANAQTGE
jgi:hypothetical protein